MEKSSSEIEFTVVISCYNEEQSIREFYTRLSATLKTLNTGYEIIFINDGSQDGTFKILKSIYDEDPHVAGIFDLFKNVGQANAKTPGIQLARGNAIVILDSDLQIDPEELPLLAQKYREGYDIVSGYRKNRRDSFFRILPSKLANVIMRKASGQYLRDFGCGFKIYSSRLIAAFAFDSFKPWRPVPVISMAGKIAEIPLSHHPRKYGKSGWTFKKLFAYNMENIVNLSQRPFQILAGICLLFSLLFILRIIMGRFLAFRILPQVSGGLILNALVVVFLLTVAILSAIGEFVIRNFVMLQKNPSYIVKTKYIRNS